MAASSGSDLNLFFHKKDVKIALLAFCRKENYISIGKVECSNNAGTGVQRFFLGEALMTLVKIENTLNVVPHTFTCESSIYDFGSSDTLRI